MMSEAICTLFEGHYHFGLAALVNSLYAHGFRGTIFAGYRGALPLWAAKAKELENSHEYTVAEGCVLRFVPVVTALHLTNLKPRFMRHIWQCHCPEADKLLYVDPDIIVRCDWAFFERWLDYGIALCEDITTGKMADNHPLRHMWLEYARRKGYSCSRQLNQYFNGGFIGLRREHRDALTIWQDLLEGLEGEGVELSGFMPGDRSHPYHATDQDTLNLLAMLTPHPLSTMGPEEMGFVSGGFTMLHAVGSPKPWKKPMTRQALKGYPPSVADKGYWQHTATPINLYTPTQRLFKRIDLRCGAAIGRFVRRSW